MKNSCTQTLSKNWFAVTAGFSPEEIRKASRRVEKYASQIYPFSNVIVVGLDDLPILCPKTFSMYESKLVDGSVGHGYFSWKAEILNSILNGHFGQCDGIVWIDAGCEIFDSFWTRKIFRKRLAFAEKTGYGVFSLNTPESLFTKRDVFEYFPTISNDDLSEQVQATHFYLFGDQGRSIVCKWMEATLVGFFMFDHSESRKGDPDDFVEHRSDQSLLSLSCKSLGMNIRIPVPPAGNRGFSSQIAAMCAPIWVSRNRHGEGIIPLWQQKLGNISNTLATYMQTLR